MAEPIRVLVAYASAAGSTAGIAERIAEVLRTAGCGVVCRPASPDLDLTGLPLWGRVGYLLMGARPGDHRDWPAVEGWARTVAAALPLTSTTPPSAGSPSVRPDERPG